MPRGKVNEYSPVLSPKPLKWASIGTPARRMASLLGEEVGPVAGQAAMFEKHLPRASESSVQMRDLRYASSSDCAWQWPNAGGTDGRLAFYFAAWLLAIFTKIVVLPNLSLTYLESAGEFRTTEWSIPPSRHPRR